MKRLTAICLLCLIAWAGRAQSIFDLDITVRLQRDGSAEITQLWDVNVVSGTEWYVPVENLGKMSISDFSVRENGRTFVNEGTGWDIDRSLEEKAGRCGIVPKGSGSLEMCWGQGSYGRHQWTVSYILHGLVQSLTDADAFNHMFVNDGMAANPQHVRITFENGTGGPEWTYDNTRVWGFGFYGEINVEDGRIIAESTEPFSSDSRVIAMVRFEKGLFEPAVSRDISFEKMQKKAFRGSDYKQDDGRGFLALLGAALAAIFGGGLFVLIEKKRGRVWKKNFFGSYKVDDWFREAPLGGNLAAAWYALSKGSRFGITQTDKQNLYGAYFLKWVLEGKMKSMPDPKKPKRVNLVLTPDVEIGDETEMSFFRMAQEAAGSDGILQAGEFERWSRKNSTRVIAWPDTLSGAGWSWFASKHYIGKGTASNNADGQKAARELVGFKNFLKDFTLSSERTVGEVGLWKDYLVYAQLFGIADKVAEQFQKLFPVEFQEYTRQYGLDPYTMNRTIRMTNNMSGSLMRGAAAGAAARSAESIKGFGGSTSFGGGGGFSGGGHGGGSR